MQRFFAIIPRSDGGAFEDKATHIISRALKFGWTVSHKSSDFVLLLSPSEPRQLTTTILPNGLGLIIGSVFPRERTPDAADTHGLEDICIEPTLTLRDKFWGQYIAFVASPAQRSVQILRDPSGRFDCYLKEDIGLTYAFSDIRDAVEICGTVPEIDWKFVRCALLNTYMKVRATGFVGVDELMAGECAKISKIERTERHFFWHPRDFATRPILDESSARDALFNTAGEVIERWAETHASFVHGLSGGLDSSILLALLVRSQAKPRVTCVNRYAQTASADERFYARLAAQHANVELIELPTHENSVDLVDILESSPLVARPSIYAFAFADVAYREKLAQATGASAYMRGHAGDQLFFGTKSTWLARDFRHDNGLSIGLLGAASAGARLSETSFWSSLRGAFRDPSLEEILSRPSGVKRRYLARDLGAEIAIEDIVHPWVVDCAKLGPGKVQQINALSAAISQDPYEQLGPIENLSPLLSQPLLEWGLRVPTYLLCARGVSRGLARHTFESALPTQIINRFSKATNAGELKGLVSSPQNASYIRTLLQDGILASSGFVAADELSATFKPNAQASFYNEDLRTVLACIGVESWLQKASSISLRAKQDAA